MILVLGSCHEIGKWFAVPCKYHGAMGAWVRTDAEDATAWSVMEQVNHIYSRGIQLVNDRKHAEAICRLANSTRR